MAGCTGQCRKVYSFSGWIKTDSVTTSAHILVLWYNTATPPENQMPSGFIKADTVGSLSGTNAGQNSQEIIMPLFCPTAQVYLECVPDTVIGNGTAWFDNLSFNSH